MDFVRIYYFDLSKFFAEKDLIRQEPTRLHVYFFIPLSGIIECNSLNIRAWSRITHIISRDYRAPHLACITTGSRCERFGKKGKNRSAFFSAVRAARLYPSRYVQSRSSILEQTGMLPPTIGK